MDKNANSNLHATRRRKAESETRQNKPEHKTKKMEFNYLEQTRIFQTFLAMDTAKLGSWRHQLIKNLRKLQTEMRDFEEAKKKALLELWPDAPQDRDIKPSEFPMGVLQKWKDTYKEMLDRKEKFDFEPFPRDRIYNDDNDIPIHALDTLEEFSLLTD